MYEVRDKRIPKVQNILKTAIIKSKGYNDIRINEMFAVISTILYFANYC